MIRLLIFIISYALVIFTLPRWGPYVDLAEELLRVPAKTALIVNLGGLIGASGLLYALTKQPNGLLYKYPSGWLQIIRTGLLGIAFATLFDLAEGLSGYAMTISNLLILPIAFMVGEAAYVCGVWVWRYLIPKGRRQYAAQKAMVESQKAASTFGDDDDGRTAPEEPSGVPRLLVTIPVYVLILVFLPRQQDFRNFTTRLENISPSFSLSFSIAAIVLAGILFLWTGALAEQAEARAVELDEKTNAIQQAKFSIYATFSISLAIGALINIIGYFIGYAPSMTLIIIMTLGFTIAEIVYALIDWRVKYGSAGM